MGLNKSFKELIKTREVKIINYYSKSLPKNNVKTKQASNEKKKSKKKLVFK